MCPLARANWRTDACVDKVAKEVDLAGDERPSVNGADANETVFVRYAKLSQLSCKEQHGGCVRAHGSPIEDGSTNEEVTQSPQIALSDMEAALKKGPLVLEECLAVLNDGLIT